MSLEEFVATLRKRWPYVLLPVVLLCLAAGLWSSAQTPLYSAKASTYFSLPQGQTANDLYQGSNFTQQQTGSYAALATQPIVLNPVINKLGLDTTAQNLARSIKASTSAEAVIVDITATSSDPQRAADLANAVSQEMGVVVRQLSPRSADRKPTISATQVAQAVPPKFQTSPNTKRNVLAAAIAGLLLGLLSALAREKLDNRVRTAVDVPKETSVLVSVPTDRALKKGLTGATGAGETRGFVARDESFRKLRTNLRFLNVDNPVRVVTVTSSTPGEGKSSTCLGLARAAAEDGQRVLVIDADLRRPRIASYLALEGAVGLIDVLAGTAFVRDAVQKTGNGKLFVLPSGSIPPNPSELLGSHAMDDLITRFRSEYDLVLIDAPPLLPVTDAMITAARSDGALLVVRHGKTTKQNLARALRSLEQVEARVLGVVLNMIPARKRWQSNSGYAYYYEQRQAVTSLPRFRRGASRQKSSDSQVRAHGV